MINWKVRAKNPNFWLSLIPAMTLLAQAVAAMFGITLDLGEVSERAVAVVNSTFVVLAILGIVTDPTTAGVGDSGQAMGYDEPRRG